MELNVKERIWLLNILPKEGDFITLKIIRNLQNDLSFSEEEIKTHRINRDEKGNLTWIRNDMLKNIEIGEKAIDIIRHAFMDLDQKKKIPMECFEVYEKFIGLKNE